MGHRGIIHSLIWWLLCFPACLPAAKLSPDQQAPLFARGSGGLILKPPFESEQRADAGRALTTNSISEEDGVERVEMASLKLVDGELVRVVEGRYSYKSPEGIPVSVNYVADENGYRAGFRLGAAALSGGVQVNPRIHIDQPGPGTGTTYLPPKTNADRSYLPPH